MKLKTLVEALIAKDTDLAKQVFHEYATAKVSKMIKEGETPKDPATTNERNVDE